MIKAKKSLGQNFLIDKNILDKIVNTTDILNKTVLEIGPGTGNLTEFILQKKPKKFHVIEKDERLINNLKKKFDKKLTIINEDILRYDLKSLSDKDLVIFGNLPYNISSQILANFIYYSYSEFSYKKLVLMFQKEVADRIIANVNTSNYGRLAILAKWKLEIKKICDVLPSSFYPKPKIDSSLLFFTPKKSFFKINEPKNIEIITRLFFNHRRKMIKKPFNQVFSNDIKIAKKLKIDLSLRPQNLTNNTYYELTNEYEKLRS